MQRSLSFLILRIQIRTVSNGLFDGFDVSSPRSFVNIRPTPHQQHGCDCFEQEVFYFKMTQIVEKSIL